VQKTYQTKRAEARAAADAVVPEAVTVALGEIAESAKEGLLALAVRAGLQVMAAMMAESVTAVCGPKGRHDPDRVGYRHGTEAGSVTLGGRRVAVRRPRVRAADGSGELPWRRMVVTAVRGDESDRSGRWVGGQGGPQEVLAGLCQSVWMRRDWEPGGSRLDAIGTL
jgi:hypothetical protein